MEILFRHSGGRKGQEQGPVIVIRHPTRHLGTLRAAPREESPKAWGGCGPPTSRAFHLSTSHAFDVSASRDSNAAAAPACSTIAHGQACVGSLVAITTLAGAGLKSNSSVNMSSMPVLRSLNLSLDQQPHPIEQANSEGMAATCLLKLDEMEGRGW
jgi:hypothetical protein